MTWIPYTLAIVMLVFASTFLTAAGVDFNIIRLLITSADIDEIEYSVRLGFIATLVFQVVCVVCIATFSTIRIMVG